VTVAARPLVRCCPEPVGSAQPTGAITKSDATTTFEAALTTAGTFSFYGNAAEVWSVRVRVDTTSDKYRLVSTVDSARGGVVACIASISGPK
jgi:hypothetical protein